MDEWLGEDEEKSRPRPGVGMRGKGVSAHGVVVVAMVVDEDKKYRDGDRRKECSKQQIDTLKAV